MELKTEHGMGWRQARGEASLLDVFRTVPVRNTGSWFRRALAFVGPGYLVSVGYMDPGNWATSIAGGAQFGYTLLFVALLSNIMAIILQSLCARLAIGSGRDLAQACRDAYPRTVSFALWVFAEIAIIATDIAEVVGTAIGLNLLFGIPLEIGVIITALDVFIVLWLQKLGFRWVEAFIIALLGVIFACFFVQIAMADPEWGGVIKGFAPTTEIIRNPQMLYLALGIIGATVMPHNLYLHSGVVQTRAYGESLVEKREALKFATLDSTVALMFALFVNASILILAAATFHRSGATTVTDLGDAHAMLAPLVGSLLEFHRYRHPGWSNRHGRLSEHSLAGLDAPPRHPHGGYCSCGCRHVVLWVARHRHFADFKSGGAGLSIALRHHSAGHVHKGQSQNGCACRPLVVDGSGQCHCCRYFSAEREVVVGYCIWGLGASCACPSLSLNARHDKFPS